MRQDREGARSDSLRAPLRVLGWPAFANRAEQPYNALLYSHMQLLGVTVAEASLARVLSGRYHVLHLHWPERRVRDDRAVAAFFRSAGLLAMLDAARARGMCIVWTVHNLAAHEGSYHAWLEPRYFAALTRRLHGFIVLSESGIAAACSAYPHLRERRAFVVPHGHMRDVYPRTLTREQARAQLHVAADANVFSFVGQVRPYKNVVLLVQQFRALGADAVLLVAGKTRPRALVDDIRAAAGDDPRIQFTPRFIADDQLQLYLLAADVVVLPYRDILNSGSALLALSFDRPVLVPRKGAMADLARRVGDDWVRTFAGELTSDTLREAMAWAKKERPPRAPLEELSWDRIARQTVGAYRALLTSRRTR